ncbi:sugar ABC transporter permease [Virgisporangium aurantiacum]|uniref:Xylose transport system permease protein XylH n=1 Tax=Virgisporangium aurantiacum TaxID=175570 RepID=A0A8J3Z802_9ACTN|nr:ABC transporter permease [Virgisporangium aurantiacum]GIJ58727.1 ABC transporter permease [Virgisporangium aurantiacum]
MTVAPVAAKNVRGGTASAPSLQSHVRDYLQRLRGGDMGSLPAIAGLGVLCIVFTLLDDAFATPRNFANLFGQGAQTTVIAMGLVFVLLLGEIDLSAGYTSGVCAAVMAILLTNEGWPWYLAVLAALVTGTVIGLVLGTLVAKIGIPSFVVTLAAFLGFQGVLLIMLGGGKNISINDDVILALVNKNLPVWLGWALCLVAILGYAVVQLYRAQARTRQGLVAQPMSVILLKIGAVAVVLLLATLVLNQERSINTLITSLKGVPIVVPIIAILLIIGTFVLSRTAFGRHLYAVGGNTEAARRAGIPVDRIKIAAFMISSTMAAVGGVLVASRANSVDPNTGGSNVLLYAVGAAVIGGTSLFGGKGRMMDAVLGGAVVAVIDNGMGLLGYSSGVKYIVTGAVLLLAAGVDALSRRRAAASGLG